MQGLGTETAFEVLARARVLESQGRDIVHLEIGEPDFNTPQNIQDAAIRAMKEGHTHYVPAPGVPELRSAIAEHLTRTRRIPVSPDEVVVTPGAKPIIFFSMLACVEPGDEVLYPNPGFPIYESMINFVGGKPIPLQLKEENDFRIDSDEILQKVTKKTRMIVLNSPENPTGGVLSKDNLKAVADAVGRRDDIVILSDEVYSEIMYEGKHESIASLPGMKEKTILLDGFSKTFAMTGWRLGYAAMPKDLADKISRLIINSVSCSTAFSQVAAIEALRGPKDEVRKMVEAFRERREVMISGLNGIEGVTCRRPAGAFYAFPNFKSFGLSSNELADGLLEKAGVACLSGTSFGSYGEGYLRLSFANSTPNLRNAITRISEYLEDAHMREAPARQSHGS